MHEGSFSGCENTSAVHAADTVILSVPFRNQAETLTGQKGALRPGQSPIDATVLMIAVKIGHTTHAGIRPTGLPDTLWE